MVLFFGSGGFCSFKVVSTAKTAIFGRCYRVGPYRCVHALPQLLLQWGASVSRAIGGGCPARWSPSAKAFCGWRRGDGPSTELMMLMHGFSSTLLGRRTRSLGRGGRRVGARAVEPPLPGMTRGCFRARKGNY